MDNQKKYDYGVQTILDRIQKQSPKYSVFEYNLNEDLPDFRVILKQNPKFIAPILTVVDEYSTTSLENAQIILIEAIGASGKTELAKNMAFRLHCPIIDLGQTKVVAGNSLTGLLTKRMERKDSFVFMDDVERGMATMIIDALDEGYMKTNNQGYLDFLDDVLSLKPKKECPIILTGRYNAVELAALHFSDSGADIITLQIEPFILQEAKEFIDKAVESTAVLKFLPIYKETRDYILSTIDGFFKDQASIKNKASERFIGYAPVLQSIAALFDEKTNYKVVLDEMKAKNIRSVELIVDIIERILKRDREQKVHPQLLELLLSNRDESFRSIVKENVYSDDEQCARILYKVSNIPFPGIDIHDASFISSYNEHIDTWIDEHPFMGKRKIGNIVFESYILARLVNNIKYKDVALQYMQKTGVSYMFAYIYYTINNGFTSLSNKVLPFIYVSLMELNTKQTYYTLNLDYNVKESKEDNLVFDVEFEGSSPEMLTYEGRMCCSNSEVIDLGSHLEHINICTPTCFLLSKRNVEAVAPSYIKCRKLVIESEELTLHNNMQDSNFMFECDEVEINQRYPQFLQVAGPGKNNISFKVICPHQLEYPLYEYWKSDDSQLETLTDEVSMRYKKLRAIILQFRSHSKHELAKHHEKIDFVIGNTSVGKSVIKALVDKKIMYLDGHLYKLDTEVMDKELGLSYDGIRNFDLPNEVVHFLESINV